MLHTLTGSPSQSFLLSDCVSYLQNGDEIILMEDGVYGALCKTAACKQLKSLSVKIYLLKADVLARGLIPHVDDKFELIDYEGFVFISERHVTQMKWG